MLRMARNLKSNMTFFNEAEMRDDASTGFTVEIINNILFNLYNNKASQDTDLLPFVLRSHDGVSSCRNPIEIVNSGIKKLAIIGDAGMGKSAFCRSLLASCNDSSLLYKIIIYLPVRNITLMPDQSSLLNIFQSLWLEQVEECNRRLLVEGIQNILGSSPDKVLVVVDGFDEIPRKEDDCQHPLAKVILDNVLGNQCATIVTSRPFGINLGLFDECLFLSNLAVDSVKSMMDRGTEVKPDLLRVITHPLYLSLYRVFSSNESLKTSIDSVDSLMSCVHSVSRTNTRTLSLLALFMCLKRKLHFTITDLSLVGEEWKDVGLSYVLSRINRETLALLPFIVSYESKDGTLYGFQHRMLLAHFASMAFVDDFFVRENIRSFLENHKYNPDYQFVIATMFRRMRLVGQSSMVYIDKFLEFLLPKSDTAGKLYCSILFIRIVECLQNSCYDKSTHRIEIARIIVFYINLSLRGELDEHSDTLLWNTLKVCPEFLNSSTFKERYFLSESAKSAYNEKIKDKKITLQPRLSAVGSLSKKEGLRSLFEAMVNSEMPSGYYIPIVERLASIDFAIILRDYTIQFNEYGSQCIYDLSEHLELFYRIGCHMNQLRLQVDHSDAFVERSPDSPQELTAYQSFLAFIQASRSSRSDNQGTAVAEPTTNCCRLIGGFS